MSEDRNSIKSYGKKKSKMIKDDDDINSDNEEVVRNKP